MTRQISVDELGVDSLLDGGLRAAGNFYCGPIHLVRKFDKATASDANVLFSTTALFRTTLQT